MKSSKYRNENALSDNNRNIWEKYRPAASINFSDFIEEKTIYDRSAGRIESTFDSSGIADHPNIDSDSMTVDEILGNSIVHEIRHLSQSHQGAMSNSIRASIPYRNSTVKFPDTEDFGSVTLDSMKESFRPAEEMLDQIQNDENEWEGSRADIPIAENSFRSKSSSKMSYLNVPKMHRRFTKMGDDFSGYIVDSSDSTDMSIGRYFSNRCQDLQDMIPARSPPRKHTPVPLVSTSFQQDEEPIKQSMPKLSSATYNKDDNENAECSVASLSTIKSHLEVETPRTFVEKVFSKKNRDLIKENVQMLEKTASELRQTKIGYFTSGLDKNPVDNPSKNTNDEFNCMMNSTKISEQEHEWRESDLMDTKSYHSGSGASSSEVTLGSGCSPIDKNKKSNKSHEENVPKKKRNLSPPTTYSDNAVNYTPPTRDQLSQRENSENIENEVVKRKQFIRLRSPTKKAPLDDVSSIMLNNLRLSSPKQNQLHAVPLTRQCATDLKPTDNHLNEKQRRYVPQNRSSDDMKMSLPAYGFHGIRGYSQDAVSLDKRCNSQCSTNSEFTQNDGKFPLKSNTSELVWECVKLRKNVGKSFVIKNTSDKRLNLKIGVIGPGFQISSPADTDSLVLQGNECRTINVTFCPTIIGKAIGKVIFRPVKNWPEETERSVHLWAYGGSTVLQLQGIERGPVGSSFLKMGETSNIVSTTLERTFSIYNKGPLNGVATIFVKPKTNQCINENHIIIEPNKCVIRPDCSINIKVIYKLRRKDVERLKEKSCEVLTVGTLEVIFGSEPNRQRIASMLTRQGSVPSAYKQLEFLVNDFPVASMEYFKDYREHVDNVSDLFGCFRTSEIALTINRTSLDESRNADLTCIDDSVLFRTLCETPKQQSSANLRKSDDGKMWSIQPRSLAMDVRNNSRKIITIQNFFDRMQTFQVNSNIGNYFNFSAKSGQIKANSEFEIMIELRNDLHIPPLSGWITIYIETDSIDVPIKVQPIPYSYM